jgi:dipeptidyl-peptidase-4
MLPVSYTGSVYIPSATARLALILCSLSFSFAQTGAKKPVTLDDVLKQPYARSTAPVWSPNGQSYAYRQQSSIYLYEAAKQKSKEWFRPAKLEADAAKIAASKTFGWQNRRVASDSIQWFPNGRDILTEAGGDLFIVHPNGKHEQLTKTDFAEEDPKLSPDATQILYRFRSNLYVLEVSSHQIRQITADGSATLLNGQLDWVYPEELDLGTATWWSPDSKQVAFLQFDITNEFIYPQTDLTGERAIAEPERYPQSGTPNARVKLGVITMATGQIKWMDAGETENALLARVIWLPDSSQLAVERLNRVQSRLEVLFCNPASGATRTVLREESKTWINFEDNLFFLKSRPEFLWTSEHENGFRHIYRYSNSGELLTKITGGDWEVKRIEAIDEARRRVFFSSSESSPLESQLYTVSFDGGARTRLTPEAGVHHIQANEDGSYFLDSYSNSTTPASQSLRNAAGEQLAVLHEPDNKLGAEFELLPSEIVKIAAEDGTPLYGRLTKPAGFHSGVKYPLIVQVYGGPGVQVVRNEWQGVNIAQAMAHSGYLVWEMDNRGSSGRGHKFEDPIFRELGTHEVQDQKRGVEYLIQQGFVDPERVGITGWSYGGYMTVHSMLLASDVFKVGVAGAPVTDWHNYDTIYTERYMDVPANNLERYNKSSNVQNAVHFEGHLLILHNFEDDNVLFQNSMQMASALEKAGKVFFMQIYPQKTHGVSGPYRKTLMEAEMSFFDRYLKDKN